MACLRGHLAHIPFSRGLLLALSCWRENFAEPLYQRIEHCLTAGSQGFGRSWHTSWALGLDFYSQYHCVVPTVASPNMESHQVDRTMTRMDEEMSKILMRVAMGWNRSLCATLEGLNEALKTDRWEKGARVIGRGVEHQWLLKKYAILYVTSATVYECVSQGRCWLNQVL